MYYHDTSEFFDSFSSKVLNGPFRTTSTFLFLTFLYPMLYPVMSFKSLNCILPSLPRSTSWSFFDGLFTMIFLMSEPSKNVLYNMFVQCISELISLIYQVYQSFLRPVVFIVNIVTYS